MLKPLTMSLGLGFALGMTSLGVAAGHHKAIPSAQGAAPSPQGVVASAQDVGCGDVCGPVKKGCGLFDLFKPKPKCYEYEWVLKKKRVHHWGGLFGGHKGGACGDACGEAVYPSAQYPSAQGGIWAAPQGAASYGSGQAGSYGSGQVILSPAGSAAGSAPADTTPATGADPATVLPTIPEPPAPPEGGAAAPEGEASNAGGLLLLSPTGN